MALKLLEKNKTAGAASGEKKPKKVKPAAPFVATLPEVNLLPDSVLEVVHVKVAQRKFALAGAAVVAGLAVLWGAQAVQIKAANDNLAAAEATGADLTNQTRALSGVKLFYTGVDAQQETIKKTMEREILFSTVVSGLQAAAPSEVTLGNVSVTSTAPTADAAGAQGAAEASSCPGPDPFNASPAVGCVTIIGTASSREAVGALLNNLQGAELFVNPFVQTTNVDEGSGVSFNGSVGLSEKVFSKRYADDAFLLTPGGAQ